MKLVSAAIFSLLVACTCQARLTETAKVRYDTSEGKSAWHELDVSFVTGMELNSLTGSIRFSTLKSYAVVFFGQDSAGNTKAAVIRIDQPSVMICGLDFNDSCLPILGKMQGPDQEGRNWEICTGIAC